MHEATEAPNRLVVHNGLAKARCLDQAPCARAANQGRAAKLCVHTCLARKVSRLVMGGLREVDEFGANGWWCAPAPSRGWCHRLVKSCRHVAPQACTNRPDSSTCKDTNTTWMARMQQRLRCSQGNGWRTLGPD